MSQRAALLVLPLFACTYEPPPGTNIGALRKPDPDPLLPTDITQLDMPAAVQEALAIGGMATLSSAWQGHVAALDGASSACPTVWVGLPPDGVGDLDVEADAGGLSWADACTEAATGADWAGFAHWSAQIAEPQGSRALIGSAEILGVDGTVLFAFDGDAADTFDESAGAYASSFAGELSGTLLDAAALRGGVRTGETFSATWGNGQLSLSGTLTLEDGFGPPDERDPATSPELASVLFTPMMPRFTSVVFDLDLTAECPAEPFGYLGLRGNEGFWFDVYFMPKYDPEVDPSAAGAFPYEEIDNVACDGVGTLFARNVSLRDLDEGDPNWTREIAPDFGAVLSQLPTPDLDAYVYTLRDLYAPGSQTGKLPPE